MLVDRCYTDWGAIKTLKAEREVNSLALASGILTRAGNLVLDHYGQGSSQWDIYYFCPKLEHSARCTFLRLQCMD